MIESISKIRSGEGLRDAIALLEIQQAEQASVLKKHFQQAYTSIKPINLITSIFSEAVESDELKGRIGSTTAGLAAGLVSKLIFQGGTKSPVKKLIGTALMFGVTNLIAKNPETVRIFTQGVMKLFKRRKPSNPESSD